MFAVLLALALVFAFVACGEKEPQKPEVDFTKSEGTMTYAEFMAAEVDAPVVIEAFVQAKQVYAAAYGNTSLYLADGDGAYFAYRAVCTQEEYDALTVGTKVKVTGFKTEWSGEVEIAQGCTFEVVAGDTWTAEAKDLTSTFGTEELVNFQNQKFTVSGAVVAASKNPDGEDVAFLYNYNGAGEEGSDLYFNVTIGDKPFQFLVESDFCGVDTPVYSAVKNLKVGDTIDVEGILYWYNGANPHVTSVTVK